MANPTDRTLAKWLVGTLLGSLGLVGVAKLGDAPRTPTKAEDRGARTCTLPGGQVGLLYQGGLCLTTPPLVGDPIPATVDSQAVGLFFEL